MRSAATSVRTKQLRQHVLPSEDPLLDAYAPNVDIVEFRVEDQELGAGRFAVTNILGCVCSVPDCTSVTASIQVTS